MTEIVEGPALAALTCGKPAFLVVLLHGEGESGQAFIDQALNWAPTLPKAEFLAAEAPGGRWFDAAEEGGLEKGLAALDRFLDAALEKRRLPPSHLALVGFSQGATLALRAGLARPGPLKAVVAFSGGQYGAPAPQASGAPPILLIHGDADEIAPLAAMREAKAAITAGGGRVWSMTRKGLGHALDDDGVIAAGDFLTEHVVQKKGGDDHDDHDHDDHDH
ncbi:MULTISPECIES: alpha/beta hydrolase [Methylosinus]|uniref:Phospholipase n=1 Tax=Methylosinus trichosporium (strain ATCC 35070 / NCIMB 11131 / UNIQEM 75 / OB3b) TaxID=595536 RepID=A0A2D2CVZ8_METT3|nr:MULTISPECIES: alpha/beta fold hydrolase [Methylosinus]ATQ66937.1 phospholipase [Methylosinus trichosporium OB3b]OBS54097.1 phospholipase [Methylosinus sp. 3S-1]